MTTMSSIQFNADGSVHSVDSNVLQSTVANQNFASGDHREASRSIQITDGSLLRSQIGPDGNLVNSVSHGPVRSQLVDHGNSMLVGGMRTSPEAAAILARQAPQLIQGQATDDAEAQLSAQHARDAAAAQAAEAEAAREEASRVDLNKHPFPEVEEAHNAFATKVPTQDAIGLLITANQGQSPSGAQLNRIADAMGVDVGTAIDRLNLMSEGVRQQFAALARAEGVDPDAAADWLRKTKPDAVMSVVQAHTLRRDLLAWRPLIAEYKRFKGDALMTILPASPAARRAEEAARRRAALERIDGKLDQVLAVMEGAASVAPTTITLDDVEYVAELLGSMDGPDLLPRHNVVISKLTRPFKDYAGRDEARTMATGISIDRWTWTIREALEAGILDTSGRVRRHVLERLANEDPERVERWVRPHEGAEVAGKPHL